MSAAARKNTYYFTAMAFLLSCFIVFGSAAAPAFAEDDATDWNNKAVGLSQAGKYEEAIAAFDKAISLGLKPEDETMAWIMKGLSLGQFGPA